MGNTARSIRIGGASGYWGEAPHATAQLLADGIDYLVYDYLAEITLSIMARARAADPNKGYATDFISTALAPNLDAIATQGVKVISNAGGVNPEACGRAVDALVGQAGLDLKVAVVTGDDLVAQVDRFANTNISEMFSAADFPAAPAIASINAYLGAQPIAHALNAGADIVITGRCVDSAVTLGACMAEFGWDPDEFDKLAMGSIAGHLIECGPQVTGGNFTDWHSLKDDYADIGYPIAEVKGNGDVVITKPKHTTGIVSPATVAEQLVYEIGDPQFYFLPDITCDLSRVALEQVGKHQVKVTGGLGRAPTLFYKVSATYIDGYKAAMSFGFVGFDAVEKAHSCATAGLQRAEAMLARARLPAFIETNVEVTGADTPFAIKSASSAREVELKIAVKHPDKRGAGTFIRAMSGLGLSAPPGMTIFQSGRPRPSPVVRLFSFTIPKAELTPVIELSGQQIAFTQVETGLDRPAAVAEIQFPAVPEVDARAQWVERSLIELAWGRSGDKGDKANIGIIARRVAYLPWIWRALDEAAVAVAFEQFAPSSVERYYLPGINAINFVLHDVLGGGGVASLRSDPQGKAYAQILLHQKISLPAELLERDE